MGKHLTGGRLHCGHVESGVEVVSRAKEGCDISIKDGQAKYDHREILGENTVIMFSIWRKQLPKKHSLINVSN